MYKHYKHWNWGGECAKTLIFELIVEKYLHLILWNVVGCFCERQLDDLESTNHFCEHQPPHSPPPNSPVPVPISQFYNNNT